jgi:predicted nucleic acid-binding protein
MELVVTPFIFAEVQASFVRDQHIRQQVIRDIWENPLVRVEQATFLEQSDAIRLLRQHHDKSFSFCDALSFVVMMRMKISVAVTFDRHFHQFGQFEVVDGSSL